MGGGGDQYQPCKTMYRLVDEHAQAQVIAAGFAAFANSASLGALAVNLSENYIRWIFG